MNTRTSRSIPGVLLYEKAQTTEVQDGPSSVEALQQIEAYTQQSRTTSESFDTFVSDLDEFNPSFTGKGDGGTSPKDIAYFGGVDALFERDNQAVDEFLRRLALAAEIVDDKQAARHGTEHRNKLCAFLRYL